MNFFSKILIIFSAIFVISEVSSRVAVIPDVNYYDCSQKESGLEVHPWDCTRFIHCDNGRAHDKSCAECHVDKITCPDGWLVFDFGAQECEWADKANATCAAPTQDTENPETSPEMTENPETSPEITENPEETTEQNQFPCNPRNCSHVGYCQSFQKCSDAGFLELVNCPHDNAGHSLWWNFEKNGNHGGVCDIWENLSAYLQNLYLDDHRCIEPCRYEAHSPCSASYTYFDGLPNGASFENQCGNGLIFNPDHDVETCDFCYNVVDNGTLCC